MNLNLKISVLFCLFVCIKGELLNIFSLYIIPTVLLLLCYICLFFALGQIFGGGLNNNPVQGNNQNWAGNSAFGANNNQVPNWGANNANPLPVNNQNWGANNPNPLPVNNQNWGANNPNPLPVNNQNWGANNLNPLPGSNQNLIANNLNPLQVNNNPNWGANNNAFGGNVANNQWGANNAFANQPQNWGANNNYYGSSQCSNNPCQNSGVNIRIFIQVLVSVSFIFMDV
jgi:hypothetical protein